MTTHRTMLPARAATALALAAAAGAASAHVTLPPGGATAGTVYPAAFRVGHACKDAASTTAIQVRLPAGFTPLEAPARAGWRITVTPGEVRWTAESPATALPAAERTAFVVRGRLAEQPGTLWFKVKQVCDVGSVDWADVPAREGEKSDTPAARLDVLPAGTAPVDVKDAWARATVKGQPASGVFAKLTTGAGLRLLGGRTPAAESVEVHEMKMEGDVMRMRALADGLALPPNESVELKPGGHHLMVMGLRQPLEAGATLPLTLEFVDAEGRRSSRQVEVPVRAAPAAASGGQGGHQH